MKYLLFGLLVVFLVGCTNDPLGATTRTDIRARTALEIEQARKDAAIGAAAAQERAAIGVAAAQERAAVGVAEQATVATIAKHQAWTSTLPTLFLIVGGIVIGSLWVNWRGRHTLAHIERGPVVSVALPTAARPSLRELKLLAAQQGMTVTVEGDMAYLVDANGETKGQRRLTG